VRLVLFDLDGTVLTFQGDPPGPGRTSMNRMMRELYGLESASTGVPFAGSTDKTIMRALFEKANLVLDDASFDRALAAYLRCLQDEMTRRPYVAIGDVKATVEECARRGARVGIATGNVREGAAIKLASAGLADVFDLDRGGYGCDAEPRADIVRRAIARCSNEDSSVEVIVVGDTRHDVAAGRAVGARVVGVANTAESRRELEEAGADAIVDTCGPSLVERLFA